jgi:uncharacterized membrane protein
MPADRGDPPGDAVRLLALSDGVFAIAITLLVLNVDLPAPSARSATLTPADALTLWLDAFSYVVSFLVIANFWVDHRRIFRYAERHTGAVTWLNVLFLMSVAFLPFPTSLLDEYAGWFPVVFYAASMAVTGVAEYALWWYVSREGSPLAPGVDPNLVRFDRAQYLLAPLVFAVSIPAAFVAVELAYVCWSLLFLLIPILKRYYGA